MEFAVIQLPRIGLLIHVRFEDADLVRLGNRNRCTAGNDNPVNPFAAVSGLKPPFSCPAVFPSLNTYAVFMRAEGTERIGISLYVFTLVVIAPALKSAVSKYLVMSFALFRIVRIEVAIIITSGSPSPTMSCYFC